MKPEEFFTNDFVVNFNENEQCLLIHTVHNGDLDEPICLKLETLTNMTTAEASKWVGETILLLIPEIRKKLFKLNDN
jgi:hypothetical protein